MLFIEGSRSIYDMRFQSWPATKWLLKIQKHTNGELDRLGWGFPEFCLKTSCRSYGTLYHVMCPDVLRCPYRLMMTDLYFQKKGKLKIIYIYSCVSSIRIQRLSKPHRASSLENELIIWNALSKKTPKILEAETKMLSSNMSANVSES